MDYMGNVSDRCCECVTCPYLDPWEDGAERQKLITAYFWIDGIFICVIAGTGILGNLFAIRVFSAREFRTTFNMFLVTLAIFDLGYLFSALLEEIPQIHDINTKGTTYPDPDPE